jgi:glycolate oxidase FAD binding subunit
MAAPEAARDATAADAVVGAAPRLVFEPSSAQQCADAFVWARDHRMSLAPVGGRTELGLGAPPTRLDAVVSARRLDRIIEQRPADQVVTVEAGITLAALQRALSHNGQRLACDPPLPDRATIGGLLATNGFGPLRTRFGSLRDLVIGVGIVRADGSFARGGGKVVKNVAGFDLPKLLVGSLGTLGMIVSATFRVHPLPEAQATLRVRGLDAHRVVALVRRMRDVQVEPAAVVALGRCADLDVLVRFEGFGPGVRDQCDAVAALAEELNRTPEALTLAESEAAWREHAAMRTRGNARVKVALLPTSLPSVAADVVPALVGALSLATTVWYPTLGLGFITGDAGDGEVFARAIGEARVAIARRGGSLVVHELPAEIRGNVDVWGPPPAAFALMRRVKERFDPDSRLNPGRFVGGL